METGIVVVEKVGGKSTVTRCFSKYPVKLIVPNKVGSSKTDAVWIYTLSYGGGIVSGDRISLSIGVGDGCTAAVTTQASTKVYKSVDSKCSEQALEVLLEQGSACSIAERMQEYHVIAMVIMLGPKLKHVQNQVQEEVKKMMSRHFRVPTPTPGRYMRSESQSDATRPAFVASCSAFGPQAIGVVVRIAAVTTESVYMFLRHHLATLELFLGVTPYQ
ncbi:urease accessory protein D isoform X2 [Elaeis guineensis]|uniref:Urease accessory protein D isoform X3 n=1 Tax=Elaeis guineensis var. tenera TaxID=51953 RepID=A0A6J0PEK3_ELAGV|nr:urease accessory protein D isoform X3 [Elaeis guineensis]